MTTPVTSAGRNAADYSHRLAFTIPEALDIVPVGRTTIYAMISAGEIETVKVRGRRLIPRHALETLVNGGADVPS